MVRGIFYASLVASLASAKDWYLSPTGTDNQTCSTGGSSSNPFKTLTNALKCAGSGDIILMKGGDYSFGSIVSLTKSITITNAPGESPRIKIMDVHAPFFAVSGAEDITISNIAVSGFNTGNQNIPSSGFIYNAPGYDYANLNIINVNFQNFEAYDGYPETSSVVPGVYNNLVVADCTFTTQYSYWSPGYHISAAAVNTMSITGNYFNQPTVLAFIQDPAEKSATGTVLISNNTFSAGNSIVIESDYMSYTIMDTTFGDGVVGPKCSVDKQTSSYATITLDNVVFSNTNAQVLQASDNCIAVLQNSVVENCDGNGKTLLTCSSATMTVTNTQFTNDDTTVTSCSKCDFTSTNNDVSSVDGTIGTCPL